MTRRTVPARIETFCDRCGILCCHEQRNYQKQGRLILAESYAEPLELDLCDDCLSKTKHELVQTMKGYTE